MIKALVSLVWIYIYIQYTHTWHYMSCMSVKLLFIDADIPITFSRLDRGRAEAVRSILCFPWLWRGSFTCSMGEKLRHHTPSYATHHCSLDYQLTRMVATMGFSVPDVLTFAGLYEEELHLVDAACKELILWSCPIWFIWRDLKRSGHFFPYFFSYFSFSCVHTSIFHVSLCHFHVCSWCSFRFQRCFGLGISTSQGVTVFRQEPTRRVVEEGDAVLTFAIDRLGLNACTSHRQGLQGIVTHRSSLPIEPWVQMRWDQCSEAIWLEEDAIWHQF